MCILLKLHYAKFGVFAKVIEEKPLRVGPTPPPPLGKGRVKGMKVVRNAEVPEATESDFQA